MGCTFFVGLLASGSAHATAPVLEVEDGITNCPDAESLRRETAAHLRRDPFDGDAAPVVVVQVKRREGGLVAEVTLTGHGTRAIEGSTCGDLVGAAALSLALAIDQDAPRVPPPRSEPSDAAPPRLEPSSVGPRPEAPLLDQAPRLPRVVATAQFASSVGVLPRAAPGVALSGRVRVDGPISVSARGQLYPEASLPNGAFSMRYWGGALGACADTFVLGRATTASFCAHAVLGALEVVHASTPTSGSKVVSGAALSAGVDYRVVGPVHFDATAEGTLPFVRPTFATEQCPIVGFQQPFSTLAVLLGAGVSIP